MIEYIVIADSINGIGKTFKKGDMVTMDHFSPGVGVTLLQRGFISMPVVKTPWEDMGRKELEKQLKAKSIKFTAKDTDEELYLSLNPVSVPLAEEITDETVFEEE